MVPALPREPHHLAVVVWILRSGDQLQPQGLISQGAVVAPLLEEDATHRSLLSLPEGPHEGVHPSSQVSHRKDRSLGMIGHLSDLIQLDNGSVEVNFPTEASNGRIVEATLVGNGE